MTDQAGYCHRPHFGRVVFSGFMSDPKFVQHQIQPLNLNVLQNAKKGPCSPLKSAIFSALQPNDGADGGNENPAEVERLDLPETDEAAEKTADDRAGDANEYRDKDPDWVFPGHHKGAWSSKF